MHVEILLCDIKHLPQHCGWDFYNTGKMKKVTLRGVN